MQDAKFHGCFNIWFHDCQEKPRLPFSFYNGRVTASSFNIAGHGGKHISFVHYVKCYNVQHYSLFYRPTLHRPSCILFKKQRHKIYIMMGIQTLKFVRFFFRGLQEV